jgi:hypothetical protein
VSTLHRHRAGAALSLSIQGGRLGMPGPGYQNEKLLLHGRPTFAGCTSCWPESPAVPVLFLFIVVIVVVVLFRLVLLVVGHWLNTGLCWRLRLGA